MATRLRLSVFVTILALFAVVVLLTGTAITVANYVQTRRAALSVADATLDATVDRITEQRRAFYTPVNLFVALYSHDPRVIQGGEQTDALLAPILRGLEGNAQISGIFVGYENGEFYQILSFLRGDEATVAALGGPPGARFAVQTIRNMNSAGRQESWRFLDTERREMTAFTNSAPVYDPRERGWYQRARAKPGEPIRTAPYVFAATPQVGLTIAESFDGATGGAVGVDVTLDRLSASLEAAQLNARHRLLIFDEEGGLIAHPDPDLVLKRTGVGNELSLAPARITDLTDPATQAVVRRFDEAGAFELESIIVDGVEFLASVVYQKLQSDQPGQYILYAAPRSEFEGSLAGAAGRSFIPGLLVILLASRQSFISRASSPGRSPHSRGKRRPSKPSN